MLNNSIIKSTNQLWKLVASFTGLVIGGILMFYGLVNIKNETIIVAFISIDLIIGIVSFLFGCFAIRCPTCKSPWVWVAINTKNTNSWLHWLINLDHCPKCKVTKT